MFSFFSAPGTTEAQPPRMTLEHGSRASHPRAGCKSQPKIISRLPPAQYGIARADARLHMIPPGTDSAGATSCPTRRFAC